MRHVDNLGQVAQRGQATERAINEHITKAIFDSGSASRGIKQAGMTLRIAMQPSEVDGYLHQSSENAAAAASSIRGISSKHNITAEGTYARIHRQSGDLEHRLAIIRSNIASLTGAAQELKPADESGKPHVERARADTQVSVQSIHHAIGQLELFQPF
jgi:hypothetical protein